MSQHDLSIANQGFPAFRADLNDALQALGSLSSGTSAPSTTYANQLWYDSTNNIVKMRNEDNDAWISLFTLDQSTDAMTVIGAITLSNIGKLDTAQSFTAAQRGAISALTDGSTVTPDFALANNFSLAIGGNRTLANPSNLTAGQSGVIVITQDGTGSRTLAYGSYWKFSNGTAPTLTTTASAVDVLAYYVESSTRITAKLVTDVK
ncbi:MAG: hypothetical protein ACO222_08010 [Polynucleobacter sp.]